MGTISYKSRILGVLLSVGLLAVGVAQATAAEPIAAGQPVPKQTPQPSPSLVPVPETPAAAEVTAESATGDEGTEFAGLSVCSPPGRFWLREDYLMWWSNGMNLPPLVTTSPAGTGRSDAGVLGGPNTAILFGNTLVGNDIWSGERTTMGMWLDCCHVWGVEGDYMNFGGMSFGFNSATLAGNPILARPFFNVQTGQQASQLVTFPGEVGGGGVTADAMQYFQSGGILLSYNLCSDHSCDGGCGSCSTSCDPSCANACCAPAMHCCRMDLLAGFRWYNLSDSLGVHENLQELATDSPIPGAAFDIHDNFSARNDFYGTEIGLRSNIYRGRWSLEILTKIAMGNTHEVVNVNGTTAVTAPGQTPMNYNTGILAGPANSGTFQRDVFTMIPEINLELSYELSCHWRTYVGYNALFWGSVSRSADQVDLNLDPRNFPPPQAGGLPFPQFPGRLASFWAQGVTMGLERRF